MVLHLRANNARGSASDMNCTTAADQTGHGCYSDVIDAVIKYEADFDGVTFWRNLWNGRWKH